RDASATRTVRARARPRRSVRRRSVRKDRRVVAHDSVARLVPERVEPLLDAVHRRPVLDEGPALPARRPLDLVLGEAQRVALGPGLVDVLDDELEDAVVEGLTDRHQLRHDALALALRLQRERAMMAVGIVAALVEEDVRGPRA